MGEGDTTQAAENFGFKRLSPDNWLSVDPAWGGVIMSASLPDPALAWVADLATVQLELAVPVEVRKLFEVARGAMAYSIMFYPLLTIGIEQMTRVMEADAAEKCRLLDAPSGACASFSRSVDWLTSRGAIGKDDEEQWRMAVMARNEAPHPSGQSIFGPGMSLRQLDWTGGFFLSAECCNELAAGFPVN
jgi:hypothetical protein